MNPTLQRRLEEFSQNHRSGSAELARQALEILKLALKSNEQNVVKNTAVSLINGQPSMAAVINTVNRFCIEVEKYRSPNCGTLPERLLQEFTNEFDAEQDKTIANAVSRIGQFSRIAAYSRSSLVEKTLLACAGKTPELKVILSEGRPGLEGVAMAENLSAGGIEVDLCVDAALPRLMGNYNLFILGADAVTETKFCNKIGSEALCNAAANHGLPVFLVVSEDKLLAPALQELFRIIELPPSEVLKDDIPNVTVFNRLFEWCDNSLVDEFIIGDAVLNASEIGNLIQNTPVSKSLREENIDD
ncbi:MAG: hypothetical protein HQ591_08655 [candidate division Zixibacteria bacterium]|nr:hypothetical protein [Candidatus Tariuqbacter arcticus]